MTKAGRERVATPWQELDDLPFAASLTGHHGGLASGEQYDGAHFSELTVDDADASLSGFLECAFTHVAWQGGTLRRATFSQVWLNDVRLTSTDAAETGWADSALHGCALAGVEAFGSRLRKVTLSGCKLDGVNFRGAHLTDVTFGKCLLRDVDFSGATLTRVSFPGTRLPGVTLTKVTMDAVDLRGAELGGITVDPTSLRGAIVTAAQLLEMAPLLAESLGITVEE